MQQIFVKSALLATGWAQNVRLTLKDGQIDDIAVGTDKDAADIDLGDQLLLPAVANLHSHSFQRAMAGLSERRGASTDSFWTWRDWR